MSFADSHVHVHAYSDPSDLLARARTRGVTLIVGVGVDLATSRDTIDLAARQRGVVPAVGFHPCHLPVPFRDHDLSQLEVLAESPSVGCIGEIGLDFVESAVPRDIQCEVFRAELALARRQGLPVNLHLRGSFDDAMKILDAEGVPPRGAIYHYFIGDSDHAREVLQRGLYISVGKPVTRLENVALRRAIDVIPLNRLVLETDSYPLPGRTTEPSDIVRVAEAVASLQGSARGVIERSTFSTLTGILRPTAVAMAIS